MLIIRIAKSTYYRSHIYRAQSALKCNYVASMCIMLTCTDVESLNECTEGENEVKISEKVK